MAAAEHYRFHRPDLARRTGAGGRGVGRCRDVHRLLALTSPAHAQTPAEFYKGKTITIIAGFPPATAPTPGRAHRPAHGRLHAGETAIRRHQSARRRHPAAHQSTGQYASRRTERSSAPSTAACPSSRCSVSPRRSSNPQELARQPDQDTAVCAARKSAPVRSRRGRAGPLAADLASHELIVGSTAPVHTATIPALLREVLSLQFKVVTGYPGSRDILLAIERDEVQGICVTTIRWRASRSIATGSSTSCCRRRRNPTRGLPEFRWPAILPGAKPERQALRLSFRARRGRAAVGGAAGRAGGPNRGSAPGFHRDAGRSRTEIGSGECRARGSPGQCGGDRSHYRRRLSRPRRRRRER